MEEAALPDGLPGSGNAQARGGGAGGNGRARAQAAFSGDGKFWAGPHGAGGERRSVALADEPAIGRSDARHVLEAIAALGGYGLAGTGGGECAEPDAIRRWARPSFGGHSRQDLS